MFTKCCYFIKYNKIGQKIYCNKEYWGRQYKFCRRHRKKKNRKKRVLVKIKMGPIILDFENIKRY